METRRAKPRRGHRPSSVDVARLHEPHPRIRAEDWRSPLVGRLLPTAKYVDGTSSIADSYRSARGAPRQGRTDLHWAGLKEDFDRSLNTYQDGRITEYAALGLACILVRRRSKLEITEVTRRGDKVDYWLGDRELLLEVSGSQDCDVERLCEEKAEQQLLVNPFEKSGYVCVADFSTKRARLWFYPVPAQ